MVECSATDLIGQYVGQTGPKTMKQLERGLGKVLFIDEAYRLGQGGFAQEAMDEMVDNITKPKFAGKMVIILAGYDDDMNNLLRVNEGLSSRFADEISFPSLSPAHCLQLLEQSLQKSKIAFPEMQDLTVYQELLEAITELSKLPSWGNARDIQTLAKCMMRAVYQNNPSKVEQLEVPVSVAFNCMHSMLAERRARANVIPSSRASFSGPVQSLDVSQAASRISSGTSTATKTAAPTPRKRNDEAPKASDRPSSQDEGRDVGVPDAVWQQLQRDKMDAVIQSGRAAQLIQDQVAAHQLALKAEKLAVEKAAKLREIEARNEAEAQELSRKREEARIREMEAKAERERIHRELERRKQEEQERVRKEELAQRRLREMGVCVAGFRWIKQADGYRCAGGSHWVTNSALGI